MKDLKELTDNAIGGIDAKLNGVPYTLTKSEEAAARSGAWGFVSTISKKAVENAVLIATTIERRWRDSELLKADIEIAKAQDEGGILAGDNYRQYRIQLRDWPEHTEFPDKNFRPQVGDA